MSTAKKINVTGLLGYKLKKTQHCLRLHMDGALKKLNLTTPQYSVLAQLELEGGISNAELARRAFITAQTMHGIVSNLEKRKLIKRKNNPNHGRILSTEVTKRGRQIVQKAHDLIRDVEKQMTVAITCKDQLLLEQLLSKCLTNLNELEDE